MLKRSCILFAILFCILPLCSCGSNSPYLPLSDVVVKLLEEEGLSNCHITYLPKYHTMESSVIISESDDEDEVFEFGKDCLFEQWIDAAEFELNEEEVIAYKGEKGTIQKYLVVGVMGYRKWKNKLPEEIEETNDIYKQYEQYEQELALSFINKVYEKDLPEETPLEKVPGFYYERLIDTTVKCSLSDEYTTYNGNKIYFTLDESSDFYNKMKKKNDKCLVFEYWVSDPEWYPSLFDFSDGTTIYKNNGMHSEHEDKNKDFSKGHILFIGIDKNDLTDQSFLTFDRIAEKYH